MEKIEVTRKDCLMYETNHQVTCDVTSYLGTNKPPAWWTVTREGALCPRALHLLSIIHSKRVRMLSLMTVPSARPEFGIDDSSKVIKPARW
jgi:hypothetical protein